MATSGRSSSVASVRTQAERRAATETRLLEAAFELVAEGGVRAVTTAAVGERAGYSRGIVNHQFGSRDKLMLRLVEEIQGRFVPDMSANRGLPRLLKTVDDYLAMVRDDEPSLRVFLRLWAAAVGGEEPTLRDHFAERDAQFRDHLERVIADGQEDAAVRPDLDPAAAATLIIGLVRGIAMQSSYTPQLGRRAIVSQTVAAVLAHGLESDAGRS